MRSNDVVWGLPYDVFLFTMLQEMLAQTLDLELGSYIHVAGSFHLYERHLALARRVLDESPPAITEMPPMQPVSDLEHFLAAERAIRLGEAVPLLSPYWANLTGPLVAFARSHARP